MSNAHSKPYFDFFKVFQSSFVPIWIEDIAPLYQQFEVLKKSGVTDLSVYLKEHPKEIPRLAAKIEVLEVNDATVAMFGAQDRNELLGNLHHLMATIDNKVFVDALVSFWNQDEVFTMEARHHSLDNRELEVIISARIPRFNSQELVIPVTLTDVTPLREQQRALSEALEEIKTLRGIIPICASCKMVRDDQGYWKQIEDFISDRTDAQFTHGICPDCSLRLYPPAE